MKKCSIVYDSFAKCYVAESKEFSIEQNIEIKEKNNLII